MLLMIELFIGDHKGLVNYSAEEFHGVWQKWAKIRFAGCWARTRRFAGRSHSPCWSSQAWWGAQHGWLQGPSSLNSATGRIQTNWDAPLMLITI